MRQEPAEGSPNPEHRQFHNKYCNHKADNHVKPAKEYIQNTTYNCHLKRLTHTMT